MAKKNIFSRKEYSDVVPPICLQPSDHIREQPGGEDRVAGDRAGGGGGERGLEAPGIDGKGLGPLRMRARRLLPFPPPTGALWFSVVLSAPGRCSCWNWWPHGSMRWNGNGTVTRHLQ